MSEEKERGEVQFITIDPNRWVERIDFAPLKRYLEPFLKQMLALSKAVGFSEKVVEIQDFAFVLTAESILTGYIKGMIADDVPRNDVETVAKQFYDNLLHLLMTLEGMSGKAMDVIAKQQSTIDNLKFALSVCPGGGKADGK